MKKLLFTLSSIGALFALAFAQGFEELGSFQTPSGNTFCIVIRDKLTNNTADLSCELKTNMAKIPAKPKNCELDWGNRFFVSERGQATRACHGDTIQNSNYKKLEYGKTWKQAGFTCNLTKVRLHCTNLEKHGFELSKMMQKLF